MATGIGISHFQGAGNWRGPGRQLHELVYPSTCHQNQSAEFIAGKQCLLLSDSSSLKVHKLSNLRRSCWLVAASSYFSPPAASVNGKRLPSLTVLKT